ncbi:MAG: hypothetical protein CMJ58_08795 [Planctomycetaceae bacterium]|nr:hypothetical protein [Planctomycetaceae bacterium]
MPRHLLRTYSLLPALVATALSVVPSGPACGQLTVDPDGVGAVDVTLGGTPLANPLPAFVVDPTAAAAVGTSGAGAFEAAGGSFLQTGALTIGGAHADDALVRVTDAVTLWQIPTEAEGGDDLTVSGAVSAVLSLMAGGRMTVGDNATLGATAEQTGQVQVDGAGSRLTIVDELLVGDAGAGWVEITGGGRIDADELTVADETSGSGTVQITGPDSRLSIAGTAVIGDRGAGTLTVSSGGAGSAARLTVGGSQTGANAAATITGAGSAWSGSSYVRVSGRETATITVEDQGTLSPGTLYVGDVFNQSGTAVIRGVGSSLSGSGTAWIGSSGVGSLTIDQGATASSGTGYLGSNASGDGAVTVQNSGSQWTAENIYLGKDGVGRLVIADGGHVAASSSVRVGEGTGSGQIELDNGTLNARSLVAAPSDIHGTGVIDAGGLVSDLSLVFDATHGLQQQFVLDDQPGQNVTLNLNMGRNGELGVGYRDAATLRIADGVHLTAQYVTLGWHAGSSGHATVDNAMLTASSVQVGGEGHGQLDLINATIDANGSVLVAPDGASAIDMDNATITARSLYAGADALRGQGTITVQGLVSDLDMVFDRNPAGVQTFQINSLPDQAVEVRLEADYPFDDLDYAVLGAGYAGEGSVTVRDGATIKTFSALFGDGPDSHGMGIVEGAGTKLLVQNELTVGRAGAAELTVTGGAFLEGLHLLTLGAEETGAGTISVQGPGSSLHANRNITIAPVMTIGELGAGALHISGGGVGAISSVSIGHEQGGTGIVTVAGPGSRLDAGVADNTFSSSQSPVSLIVGNRGAGQLLVTGGGQVTSDSLMIAGDPSATGSTGLVHVDGPGSALSAVSASSSSPFSSSSRATSSRTMIGAAGRGELRITNGGAVTTPATTIGGGGFGTAGTGIVTVDGPGSSWRVGAYYADIYEPFFSSSDAELVIGDGGAAEISITNGAAVYSGTAAIGVRFSGAPSPPAASVVVSGPGSLWELPSTSVTFGDGFQINAGGILTIADGAVVRSGRTRVQDGGRVTVNNARWTVFGDFTTSGSTFRGIPAIEIGPHGVVEISGRVTSNHFGFRFGEDLTTAGRLALDESYFGTFPLKLTADDDFAAAVGERALLVTKESAGLGALTVSDLSAGDLLYQFTVDLQPTEAFVEVDSIGWAADFDDSGVVDATDLARWQANYGRPNMDHASGDANLDGQVAGDDFLSWQRAFGQPLPTAQAAAVPEPMAGTLAAFAAVATGAMAGRRRRNARRWGFGTAD